MRYLCLSNVTIHAHSYITEVLWIDCTQNVQFSNFWLLKKKKRNPTVHIHISYSHLFCRYFCIIR